MQFVNGYKEVEHHSKAAKLIQLETGEVYFKELGTNATNFFEFYSYDRTENIKRSQYRALTSADLEFFFAENEGLLQW